MRRGFTLLETIFASVLFGFILLFLLNLYPSSMVAVKRGETQLAADNYAQSILEDLRSRSFANVTVGDPPSYNPYTFDQTEFTPNVSVTYLPDSSTDEQHFLKKASVTVHWKFQNRNLEVTHSMYLHNVTR